MPPWLFIIPGVISADCLGLRAVTVHDPVNSSSPSLNKLSLLHTPVTGFSAPQFPPASVSVNQTNLMQHRLVVIEVQFQAALRTEGSLLF